MGKQISKLQVLLVVLGITSILLFVFIEINLQYKGFPDGHKTVLDLAEIKLFNPFKWINILFGISFFYLAWLLSRKEVKKVAKLSIVLYLILLLVIAFFEYYYIYILQLDNGIGG